MSYDTLPLELKELKQWGLFKKLWNPDTSRYTKIPINAMTGQKASSTDDASWTDFNEASLNMEIFNADGLAFFLKPPYIAIDMDHYADDIERFERGDHKDNPISRMIYGMESYSEVSVSGDGLHVIVKGNIPGTRHKRGNFEMYDSGRFIALTGNAIGQFANQISEVPDDIIRGFYDEYIGEEPEQKPGVDNVSGNYLTETQIIDLASGSANGSTFSKLFNGDWQNDYPSQSDADLAFANILAFWTAHDRTMMDSIFRQSGLYREKWDERHGATTYGEATINRAINDGSDVYTPGGSDADFELFIEEDNAFVPKESLPQRDFTDQGIVERLIDRYGKVVRHISGTKSGEFMIFDGKVWRPDKTGQVHRLILKMSDVIRDHEQPRIPSQPEMAMFKEPEEAKKAMRAWEKQRDVAIKNYYSTIDRLRSNPGVKAVKEMLSEAVKIDVLEFDGDKTKNFLNTPNGIYDLTSGERFDNAPEYMFTKITSVAPDPDMEPKEFMKFLRTAMQEREGLVEYVLNWIGYSITGTGTQQEYIILLGKGRNGKGVLMNSIKNAIGDYFTSVDPATMSEQKNQNGNNDELARLNGARLVSLSEFPQNAVVDSAKLKKLTGGGTFVANPKYEKPYEFTSNGVPIIDTNYLPRTSDMSEGMWQRTNVIPFDNVVKKEDQDPLLTIKLARESGALLWLIIKRAIAFNSVAGLLNDKPKEVLEQNQAYRLDSDEVGEFVDTYFDVDMNNNDWQTPTEDIHAKFDEWAAKTRTNLKYQGVSRELNKRFGHKRSSGRYNVVYHIKLKEAGDGFSVNIGS